MITQQESFRRKFEKNRFTNAGKDHHALLWPMACHEQSVLLFIMLRIEAKITRDPLNSEGKPDYLSRREAARVGFFSIQSL